MPDDLDAASVFGGETPDANVSAAGDDHEARKPAVSSAALRAQIEAIEATLADLTNTAALAGLASYGAPDNLALRHDVDAAMAALQSANGELERLRLALPAAEQQEAANAGASAAAERQRAKDRLLRERDRLQRLADIEAAKGCDAYEALPAAEAELADLEHQRQNQQVAVDVLLDRFHNASDHNLEYTAQVAAIDAQIAAFPVTAEEVAADEAAQQVARDAEAAERLADLTAETDRQLREIYANELIEVPAPYTRTGASWATGRPGEMARMPRHRVAAHERDMAEAVAWIGRQEAERLERARREEQRQERNRAITLRDNDEPTAADFLAAQKFNRENGGV
jgi:hypothetical protein